MEIIRDMMNDIHKKDFCDILNSSGPELRNALDDYFRASGLSEPGPEDYRLMDKTIETIQMMTWNSATNCMFLVISRRSNRQPNAYLESHLFS